MLLHTGFHVKTAWLDYRHLVEWRGHMERHGRELRIFSFICCLGLLTGVAMLFAPPAGLAADYPFRIDEDALSGAPVSTLNRPLTQADVIRVKDGHFYTVGPDLSIGTADDVRVKFWGVNLLPPLVFPKTQADADLLAARLAKLGFNLVRLHGLDNVSADQFKTILQTPLTTPFPQLNSTNLQALDWLFDAFKNHGIYVDLNLKVGYQFSNSKDCYTDDGGNRRCVADPLAKTPQYPTGRSMPPGSGPLDLFDNDMKKLQKDYFKLLLSRYGDHPTIAMVEINNENSLMEEYWMDGSIFPPLYATELDVLWNTWLKQKYGDDGVLRTAWEPPPNPSANVNMVQNANFATLQGGLPVGWVLEQTPLNGQSNWGSIRIDTTGEALLSVDNVPQKYWYVLLGQRGLSINQGTTYRLQFSARSDAQRKIRVTVQGLGQNYAANAMVVPILAVDVD